MKFLKLSTLLPLSCLLALGQDAANTTETVSPEVDQALRARVAQFYSANITGKWRDAFQVVADDMQDAYLAAGKDTYDKCETIKITYIDNFTKASVRENCHGEYRWHNSHIPATIPLTSTWKLVDGQWWWYWTKPTEVMTPFGLSKVTPEAPRAPGSSTVDAKIETVLRDPAAMAKNILGLIKVDKKEIRLSGYETSRDELHISNTMPGTISVRINCPPLPGFHVKQSSTDIGPKETSTIVFEYDAEEAKKICGECSKLPKPRLTAGIRIEPTAQYFAVKITFGIPPSSKSKSRSNCVSRFSQSPTAILPSAEGRPGDSAAGAHACHVCGLPAGAWRTICRLRSTGLTTFDSARTAATFSPRTIPKSRFDRTFSVPRTSPDIIRRDASKPDLKRGIAGAATRSVPPRWN